MSKSDKTSFTFLTKFVGRKRMQDTFIWAIFEPSPLPLNSDYMELARKGLSPDNLMPWIREIFGPKATGCTIQYPFLISELTLVFSFGKWSNMV